MDFILIFASYVIGGIFGGILLGLVGVGMALVGVPILILTLPYVGFSADTVPHIALAASMGIVTMGSISSLSSHYKLGNIDWQIVKALTPYSVAGVLIGSFFASHLIPGHALRWILCAIELFIAWTMLRPTKPKSAAAIASPMQRRSVAATIGLSGSVIGAGGGVFMVPYLSHLGLMMRHAVASSTAIGFPVTLLGTIFYLFSQLPIAAQSTELPSGMLGMLYLPAMLGLGAGSMIGAPYGAKLGSSIDNTKLRKGFGVLLIILAVSVVVF